MQRYNVREAKDHLSKLVDDVLEGQRVLITRNGVTVAELIPFRRRPFPLGVGRNDVLINRETLTTGRLVAFDLQFYYRRERADINYWLDLFTGETWEEFRKAGAKITGFRESRRKSLQRVRPGRCVSVLPHRRDALGGGAGDDWTEQR